LTIKSGILTERQKAVIETIRMRLTEQQSLQYLKEVGFPCSTATFYREKKKVEEMKLKRLYHIASIGFQDQHLDRIDNTELCLKLMWQNYNEEQDPYKKFQMLKDIILVQPYLSAYYETTKLVMHKQKQSQSTTKIYSNNNNNLKSQKDLDFFNRHQSQKDEYDNIKENGPNRKF
jgi:hypothetical protein